MTRPARPEELTETWGQQSRRLSCVVALDLDEHILRGLRRADPLDHLLHQPTTRQVSDVET